MAKKEVRRFLSDEYLVLFDSGKKITIERINDKNFGIKNKDLKSFDDVKIFDALAQIKVDTLQKLCEKLSNVLGKIADIQ